MAQKARLAAFRLTLGRGWNARLLEPLPYGRAIQGVTAFEHLPFEAVVAPTPIVPRSLEHSGCPFGADFRTSAGWFRLEGPFTADPLALPRQDGVGSKDQHRLELGTDIARDLLHLGDEDGP